MSGHLLDVRHVHKSYPLRTGLGLLSGSTARLHAVHNLSFYIEEQETYGLVGESGCGKTTTGNMIAGIAHADLGEIWFEDCDICTLKEKELRQLHKKIQMVFQGSLSSLNPRQRIGPILLDILKIHNSEDPGKHHKIVMDTLHKVGLSDEIFFRFPHELSGGQAQRLGIACALVVQPKLLVCDEPVSALDVSIQAQILNTLLDLKDSFSLSMLFISHDIDVVRFISDRIGVMYMGAMMEEAPTDQLFENPQHPYTRALLESIPSPYTQHKKHRILQGEQKARTDNLVGCAFHSRCPYTTGICKEETPPLHETETSHWVACHRIIGQ